MLRHGIEIPHSFNCADELSNQPVGLSLHYADIEKKTKVIPGPGSIPASKLDPVMEARWETFSHLSGTEDLDYVVLMHH